ncbi:MAG: cache domain-containing protein [Lachnospiraceae bacterium]|nr:cache domain-containing protein [Lachnospiraceae bacterium]
MKRYILNFKKLFIMFALIPLIVGIIVLSLISISSSANSIEDNIKEELRLAAKGLREYYEYDLVNDNDLEDGFCEYDTDYLDKMATTGIDFTLFKGNVRFMTTIKNEAGERIEGTSSGDGIWETIQSGEDYYSNDVVINDVDYYVYYMPLLGSDGKAAGMAFAGKPTHDIRELKQGLILRILISAVVLILFFLIGTIIISRKISTPLKNIANNIKKLSNGEPVSIKAKSIIHETVSLIESAKRLSYALNESISKIRASAGELKSSMESTSDLVRQSATGAEHITKSMDSLSQATETMAESVQEINTKVISMGSMIENIVANTEHLNASSDNMLAANEEAAGCIDNMSVSSKKSAEAIEIISRKISDTNTSIRKIEEMVGFITEIADQTNLLALNASIEAARAGESGRGFGVVAEEIKHLAEQSNDSAMRITEIVSEISAQSDDCVAQSREVEKIIAEEQRLLGITRDKFNVLDSEIKTSVNEIDSVSAITDELNDIKEVITNAVTDLSAISEQTAATNEEVTSSVSQISKNVITISNDTDHLNELSDSLRDAVSYFKL